MDCTLNGQRWYQYVTERLNQLERGEGDFTGLKRPSKEIVDVARTFANSFFTYYTPTPSVVPDEDGNVVFVWHKSGRKLEIIVGLEDVTVWVFEVGSKVMKSGTFAELWPTILDLWIKEYNGNF